MSPGELATVAAVAQQVLGLVMMPMMPFMLPMNPALVAAAMTAATSSSLSPAAAAAAQPTTAAATSELQPTASPSPADALSDALAASAPPLALLGAPFALPPTISADDIVPKRKRGRPPKRDAAARAKADAERALKQLPIWGYGLPLPLFPGFPAVLGGGAAAANAVVGLISAEPPSSGAQTQHDAALPKDADAGFARSGAKPPPKKKARGTGKPRGRPRTRPQPGDPIRRVKPLAIAPATPGFPALYNYQLSRAADANAEDGASHDDERFGAGLLPPGEHE